MISELVSVVITTYKREPVIVLRAVESVLKQTYKNIEIIIVDDSPSDYSFRKDVCKAIDEKISQGLNIRYIPHKENMGACAARNTGMVAANGIYIAYLDDDDEWLPNKIEKQVEVIKKSKTALVYCGWIYQIDTLKKRQYGKTKFLRGDVFHELLYGNFINSTSFPLLKLDCLKAIGGFDISMESAQDFDVWLRISKNYNVDFVQQPLVIYHEHDGEQITNNPVKKINGLERINIKYKQYIDSDSSLWWIRHIILTPYYAMNGEKKKAIKIWFTCVKKQPLKIIGNMRYLRIIIRTKTKVINGQR